MGKMTSGKKMTGGGSVPKLGGSGAGLSTLIAQMQMLPQKQEIIKGSDIEKENELAGSVGETESLLKSQFEKGFNRGDKLTRGGFTRELNPRLNADERGDVASMSIMEPHFKNIVRMVNEGYLDDPGKSPIKRTMRQGIVDIGQPLLSSQDERLKQIQSEFNRLKSKLPFDAGGKQLTGTEKALVFKLFNITGKDNATIIGDLNFAMDMIRERARLALGGANAAVTSGPAGQATVPSMAPKGTPVSPNVSSGQRIKVVNLTNGKRGTIDPNDFDPKKYSKV